MHSKDVNCGVGVRGESCRRMHKAWFCYIKCETVKLNSSVFRHTKCGKALKKSMRMVNVILTAITSMEELGE